MRLWVEFNAPDTVRLPVHYNHAVQGLIYHLLHADYRGGGLKRPGVQTLPAPRSRRQPPALASKPNRGASSASWNHYKKDGGAPERASKAHISFKLENQWMGLVRPAFLEYGGEAGRPQVFLS